LSTEKQRTNPPDSEVTEKPVRRHYTAEYKRRIVTEWRACTHKGEVGALLRREGLYSSLLYKWRDQEDVGLSAKPCGRKPSPEGSYEEKRQLRRENARLRHRLEQAEAIIEIQKKVSILLGITLKQPENDERGLS